MADISGFTAFLTGTELEHAYAIVHELTSLIREQLAPPMPFVKLEGDAVFCYADQLRRMLVPIAALEQLLATATAHPLAS